jgi:hypothetical protein
MCVLLVWWGEGVILCLYVDDILIFGISFDVIKEAKQFLSNNFEMKDLGETDVILNIKLLRESIGGVTLLQSHYVENVLSCLGLVTVSLLLRPMTLVWRIARDQLRYS